MHPKLLLVWIALITQNIEAQQLFITSQWCYGEQPIVIVDSTNGLTPPLRYSFNGEAFTNSESYTPNASAVVTITVQDANGIESSKVITLFPSSEMIATYDSTHKTCENSASIDILQVSGGIPPLSYTLNGAAQHAEVTHGKNELIITDATGCTTTKKINLHNLCWKEYNGFSPNDDGVNDTWEIDELIDFPDAFVQVKNRFGQIMFRSEGEYIPWDGSPQLAGKCPSGSYLYQIFPFGKDNTAYEISGILTISR